MEYLSIVNLQQYKMLFLKAEARHVADAIVVILSIGMLVNVGMQRDQNIRGFFKH